MTFRRYYRYAYAYAYLFFTENHEKGVSVRIYLLQIVGGTAVNNF